MSAFTFLVLYALLQNVDNLVLAAAYRLRNVTITSRSNLIIAGLSGIATGAGVIVAQVVKLNANHFGLGSTTEIIGRGILVMIGVWTLVGYFRARLFPAVNSPHFDERGSALLETRVTAETGRPMSLSEAVISGTALAIDNLAPSFAFGLVNPAPQSLAGAGTILALLTAVFSVASVVVGQAIGARGRNGLRWVSPEIASASLIICIAILDPGDVQELLFHLVRTGTGH
jgi:putative Mn2+ efflux pump MntP